MGKAGFIMRGARAKVGNLVMMKGENWPISGCFETVERKAVSLIATRRISARERPYRYKAYNGPSSVTSKIFTHPLHHYRLQFFFAKRKTQTSARRLATLRLRRNLKPIMHYELWINLTPSRCPPTQAWLMLVAPLLNSLNIIPIMVRSRGFFVLLRRK